MYDAHLHKATHNATSIEKLDSLKGMMAAMGPMGLDASLCPASFSATTRYSYSCPSYTDVSRKYVSSTSARLTGTKCALYAWRRSTM